MAAAADLIRVQGVAGMSISDLVAQSGTSAGAIYHHFGSKQGLVLEVARRVLAGPVALALATPAEGHLSPAALFRAAASHVAADTDTPALVLQIWAGARTDPALHELLLQEAAGVMDAATSLIREWCAQHGAALDPDGVTEMLVGLVMGFAVQRALLPSAHPDAYLEVTGRLLDQLGR